MLRVNLENKKKVFFMFFNLSKEFKTMSGDKEGIYSNDVLLKNTLSKEMEESFATGCIAKDDAEGIYYQIEKLVDNQKKLCCYIGFTCILMMLFFIIHFIVLYRVIIPHLQKIEATVESNSAVLYDMSTYVSPLA